MTNTIENYELLSVKLSERCNRLEKSNAELLEALEIAKEQLNKAKMFARELTREAIEKEIEKIYLAIAKARGQ